MPTIAKHVAISGAMTEDQLIQSAQQMDLIYSQSSTLYDLIPLVARPASDPTIPSKGPHADGVIGFVIQIDQCIQQMGQVPVQTSQTVVGQENQYPANPTQTSKILTVQATYQKGKNKKQNKNPNTNSRTGDAPRIYNQPKGN